MTDDIAIRTAELEIARIKEAFCRETWQTMNPSIIPAQSIRQAEMEMRVAHQEVLIAEARLNHVTRILQEYPEVPA